MSARNCTTHHHACACREAMFEELLAALQDLMPTITCMERHGIRYDPAQVDAARAAIAKATGQ